MAIVIIIVSSVILLDQLTKQLVVHFMGVGESIPIIDNFLYLTSHRNAGAAWGIFQDQMIFFYIVTVLVVGTIVMWLRRIDVKHEKILLIAFSLLLGGAIGNFIDRLLFQEVVDFIDTFIFGYNFPIFNVADIALSIGFVFMVIDAVLEMKRGKVEA